MLFNTIQFAVFYLVVAMLYFAVPGRFRWALLLAASYYFYMCWNAWYILLIAAITLVDYCAGLLIEQASGKRRRLYLAISIACNFGLLFVFKYADFFMAAVGRGFPQLHWLLPVGISFHTFQGVSYTFDVYRRKAPAERHLGMYALYVAFFPQMVAGPIERPGHLLPQLRHPKPFEAGRVSSGLRLALWGLIKKTVIADLAAPAVNTIYAHPQKFPAEMLWLGTLLFAVQIYCDFSGYSDIAVGTARVLGYDLTINFREPYLATSIAEFWRKWHVSLSTWFRDYLYVPLGGNRASGLRWTINIAVVFLISGLWHGADWTFVTWGALHGGYAIAGKWTRPLRERLAVASGITRYPRLLTAQRILITNLLVGIAWIFFRANTPGDAVYVITHLWAVSTTPVEGIFRLGLPRFEMTFLLIAFPFVFLCEYILRAHPSEAWRNLWGRSIGIRWSCYIAGAWAVVFFGVFKRVDFIYFQF